MAGAFLFAQIVFGNSYFFSGENFFTENLRNFRIRV
jgi:hypothetical protein